MSDPTMPTAPTAPARSAPDTYNSRSDAFWAYIEDSFVSSLNTIITWISTQVSTISGYSTTTEAAKTIAVAAAGASVYSAVATYSVGDQIIFTDGFSYTCISGTSAGQSPTTNPTKWQQITLGPILFEEKTSNFTADYGGNYILMNTSGATVTLPATLAQADPITLVGGLSAVTNNVTVARNGNTIGRVAEDLTIDTEYYRIEFTPVVSTDDWQIGGSVS